jgi:hypothetical protein
VLSLYEGLCDEVEVRGYSFPQAVEFAVRSTHIAKVSEILAEANWEDHSKRCLRALDLKF